MGLRVESAFCIRIGSRIAPVRSSFLIALASAGLERSIADSESFLSPRPSSGTFISPAMIGRM